MGRYKLIVILLAISTPVAAETSFYQCKDKWGQPIFSQQPCGADATQGTISAPERSGSVHADQESWDRITTNNTIRDAEREIEHREKKVSQLVRERDLKIAALDRRQENAMNNLAGAQFRESLATEMQAVNMQYHAKIEREQRDIDRIREQMALVRATY